MKYELRVTCIGEASDFSVISHDVLLADNLVILLSQFILLIAALHRRELEEQSAKLRGHNAGDDVPF